MFLTIFVLASFYFPGQLTSLYFPTSLKVYSFGQFIHLDVNQFLAAFPPPEIDMMSYITQAKYILIKGYFNPAFINTWPPGEPLVIAALIKLTGMNDYPLKMIIINALVWSLAMVVLFNTLSEYKNVFVRFFLVLLPFYFPSFTDWIFGPGLFMSELISIPLFLIAICYLVRWFKTDRRQDLIAFAIFFAIIAYFRGYFEIFSNFLILLLILTALITVGWIYLKTRIRQPHLKIKSTVKLMQNQWPVLFSEKSKTIVISILVFCVALLPWRIYHHHVDGTYAWQNLSSYIWWVFWGPRNSYFIDINLACQILPNICKALIDYTAKNPWTITISFYRNLTLMVLITHPIKWYALKLFYFNRFWFGGGLYVYSWFQLLHYKFCYLIEGFSILIFGLMGMSLNIYYYLRYRTEQLGGLLFFSLSFILFNIVLFSIFHYEPRYSLYLRMYFLYYPFIVVALLKNQNIALANEFSDF